VYPLRPADAARLVDAVTGGVLPDGPPRPRPARVQLRPAARLDREQARAFLMNLDASVAGADLPRMAYLLGVLEGHAQSLLDALDSVTEV